MHDKSSNQHSCMCDVPGKPYLQVTNLYSADTKFHLLIYKANEKVVNVCWFVGVLVWRDVLKPKEEGVFVEL